MTDDFDGDAPDLPAEPENRPLTPEQAVALAGALIRLRRETFAQIERTTQVRSPNLSAWLKGKPQVINALRVARLLDHLGVRNGILRDDVVHRWTVIGTLKDLKFVLDQLVTLAGRDRVRVIREWQAAESPWALIALPTPSGRALSLVKAEADLNGMPVVSTAALGFGEAAWTGDALDALTEASRKQVAAMADAALDELDMALGQPFADQHSGSATAATVDDDADDGYAQVMAAVSAALARGVAPKIIVDAIQRLSAKSRR